MEERPVFALFSTKKNCNEILKDNDFNREIEDFITRSLAKIGKQWVLNEIDSIFETAYWLCGSLSHDFRETDTYESVVNSLSEHICAWYRSILEFPDAMDALHAIVYLMLRHDKYPQYHRRDVGAAISCIKNRDLAYETACFSSTYKGKYEYDYSISIDRNWRDCEIKKRIKGWHMEPEKVAERIVSFASYFDEDDKEGMMNRAFSEAIDVAKEEGCVSWFDEYDDIDEYKEAVRTNLLERINAGELNRKKEHHDKAQLTNMDEGGTPQNKERLYSYHIAKAEQVIISMGDKPQIYHTNQES